MNEQAKPKEREYDELLDTIRSYIKQEYGSVYAFTKHPDFVKKCGFKEKEWNKVNTYLYRPKDGADKSIGKSFPTLKQLYKGLLGIELTSKRSMEVKVIYFSYGDMPKVEEAS